VLVTVAGCASCGCSTTGTSAAHRAATTTTPTTSPSAPATTTTLLPPTTAAPAFVSTVAPVSAPALGGTYHDGYPVAPDQLRLVQVTYWGFDHQPHVGTIVVSADVVEDVRTVFSTLFARGFPIRQMEPEAAFGGSDPEHAYGDAIDVNPVENPYLEDGEDGTVQPDAGAAYLDRADARPGMAVADGPLVAAFASVGWQWGGRWTDAPDYQHFSKSGG
jgi:D-alanyl-D-alanine carboxypeptidase